MEVFPPKKIISKDFSGMNFRSQSRKHLWMQVPAVFFFLFFFFGAKGGARCVFLCVFFFRFFFFCFGPFFFTVNLF